MISNIPIRNPVINLQMQKTIKFWNNAIKIKKIMKKKMQSCIKSVLLSKLDTYPEIKLPSPVPTKKQDEIKKIWTLFMLYICLKGKTSKGNIIREVPSNIFEKKKTIIWSQVLNP